MMTDPNQDDATDTSAETYYGAHEQCDSDNSMEFIFPNLTIVLAGNSSSVQFGNENLLLGQKQPNTESATISRIVRLQKKISERHVSVINMIDLHDAELYLDCVDHLIGQLVNENEIHAFIFVVQLGQLTDADKMGLEWLQRVFGDKVLQFVMILFTYDREEECDTIIDDLKKNPVLEQLLEKCGGRYLTCNKKMNNQSEMTDLMNKTERLYNENKPQRYSEEMYNTAIRQREELKNIERQSDDRPTRMHTASGTSEKHKICQALPQANHSARHHPNTDHTHLFPPATDYEHLLLITALISALYKDTHRQTLNVRSRTHEEDC